MRACWYEQYGAAADVLRIGERPNPRPAPGEVLVRLHASGANPSDVKKRQGAQPALDRGWVIPHSDGAGVIETVGADVSEERIGERVWVYQAQYQRRFGTAAEYVTLPVERAVTLPETASFAVGACLGIPAMTAHRSVFADGSVAGKSVLITGAAGRVGDYAVQWAKQDGATVIATVGSPANAIRATESGADLVLNYHSDDVVGATMDLTDGCGVARVIDVEFGLNLSTTLAVIQPNGVIATYASMQNPEPTLPFYPMMFKDLTLRTVLVYAMPEHAKQQAARDITDALAAKTLNHRVAQTYSLDRIASAHEAIEQGGVPGCVIVEIN